MSEAPSKSKDQAALREKVDVVPEKFTEEVLGHPQKKEAKQLEDSRPARTSILSELAKQETPPAETGTDTSSAEHYPEADAVGNTSSSLQKTLDEPVAGKLVRPRFDLVRVEPDGSAIIAGRGGPGDEIVTELGGKEIGRTTAGSDGTFVQVLNLPIVQAPLMIRLWVSLPNGDRFYALEDALLAPSIVALKDQDEAETPNTDETTVKETETNSLSASIDQTIETADARAVDQPKEAVALHSQFEEVGSGKKTQQESVASQNYDATISSSSEQLTLLEMQNSKIEPVAGNRSQGHLEQASKTEMQASEIEAEEAQADVPAVLMAGTKGARLLRSGYGLERGHQRRHPAVDSHVGVGHCMH